MIDAAMPEVDGFALARLIAEESIPTGPLIFMLSPVDLRDDLARLRAVNNALI